MQFLAKGVGLNLDPIRRAQTLIVESGSIIAIFLLLFLAAFVMQHIPSLRVTMIQFCVLIESIVSNVPSMCYQALTIRSAVHFCRESMYS